MSATREEMGAPIEELRKQGFDSALLHTPTGFQALRNFTLVAHGDENLDFWYQIELYKAAPQEHREAISKELWDAFIIPRAPKKINTTGTLKSFVETHMNAGTCSQNTWDGVQAHCYKMLTQNHWTDFLNSQIGTDYADRVAQAKAGLGVLTSKGGPRLKEKQVFAMMRGDIYVKIATRYAEERPSSGTIPTSVSAKEIEDWLVAKAPNDHGIEDICENLVSCDLIYSLDPEDFDYNPASYYRVKGIVYPIGKEEYTELLEAALERMMKVNSVVLGWNRLKNEEIFPLPPEMKVWKRKGDVSDIWKSEFTVNMNAEAVFEILCSSCLGNMLNDEFQVLEDVENIRICSYVYSYPDLPQAINWLTVQTGRKWKDSFIILETSLHWHPSFSINQNYHSQANLVYRAVILDPKKHDDTNITYYEYSEVSALPLFRLNFAQTVTAIVNFTNPAMYPIVPTCKKLFAEAPEYSKKKSASLLLSALTSKSDKRKTTKIHSPPGTSLRALEDTLSKSPTEEKEKRRKDKDTKRVLPAKINSTNSGGNLGTTNSTGGLTTTPETTTTKSGESPSSKRAVERTPKSRPVQTVGNDIVENSNEGDEEEEKEEHEEDGEKRSKHLAPKEKPHKKRRNPSTGAVPSAEDSQEEKGTKKGSTSARKDKREMKS